MSDEILEKAGLTNLGVEIYGGDTVHYWMRKERFLSYIMLEGGPPTSLSFLEKIIIDRAIIIRLPVTFIKPFGLVMSDEILEKAGLTKLGVEICGGDTIHYWTRKERYLFHVMVEGELLTDLDFLEERMVDKEITIQSPVTFRKPEPS